MYIYIYIYISISLSLYIYIYIYIYVLYGYIFSPVPAPRFSANNFRNARPEKRRRSWLVTWTGTTGVSTNGVTANFSFFDSGAFCVLPLTYLFLPKSARAYLFPQSVKIHYFCSGPISVDPICPQPTMALPARESS